MIKEQEIEVIGHPRNYSYYKQLGYNVEIRKPFNVKSYDLTSGSCIKVTCICDNCGKETINVFKDYWNYTNGLTTEYYCISCKTIKSKKTSIEKWGVENPMQSDIVKQNLKKSILEKYGVDWYSKTDEWLIKFKNSSNNKFDVDNPSKCDYIKDIIKEKNKYLSNNNFIKDTKNKKERNTWKKYANLLDNEYEVISYKDYVFKIKHKKCGEEFSITKGLLYNRLKSNSIVCTNCNKIGIQNSSFEVEIHDYLISFNINIEKRNRSILNGLELDIYLPDYKLAIECNGVYWHNELFKDKKYHLNKTLKCKENGINLIHIWEDDWNNKKDIVKSILRYKIGVIDNKIWARKCEIKVIKNNEYKKFLNNNHIQGFASSSYNIGLYYENELVSLMTFCWRRINNKREYELVRFCNKLNTVVVGSASKLFNYFKNNLTDNIVEIISYSDISIFNGNLYENLGFYKKSLSEPNYFWVVNGIRKHRYNFSKRKLVQKGYDINKTEVEIMNDLGYYRIFSTGQEKWIYLMKN